MEKPSFGKPLEEHLAVSGREIAFPVEACVTMLLECGMQEEVRWRGMRNGGASGDIAAPKACVTPSCVLCKGSLPSGSLGLQAEEAEGRAGLLRGGRAGVLGRPARHRRYRSLGRGVVWWPLQPPGTDPEGGHRWCGV